MSLTALAIGAFDIIVLTVSIVYVLMRYSNLHDRIKTLERIVYCDHCWHWTMTSSSRLRTYQHCCKCGGLLAVYGEERVPDPRVHGPYRILVPGLATNLANEPQQQTEEQSAPRPPNRAR